MSIGIRSSPERPPRAHMDLGQGDRPEGAEPATTPVIDFYAGKSIFITGGTGFLGLVLVEKLLYACERIENLYLLIRPKKGKTAGDRLAELMTSSAFQRLKTEKPRVLEKIVPIRGDVREDCLGIAPEEQDVICGNTAVVFHVAASINLDASLKDALDINAKGTLNVLNLCQKMAQLQALVHVSSAYSNCNRDFIAEKIYPTLAPLDAVYHLLENGLDSPLTRNVVDKRPNNYTYSKAVAEELVAHERGRVPAAIVRPTIIISSKSEPAKGWVDNWGGANGPIVGMGKGLVRTWPAAPDTMIDFVPVDMVANLLIAVAWDTHVRKGDKEVKVYNCSCGVKNPLTSRNFLRTCLHYTRKHQFRNVRWYPTLFMTDKKLLMWTVTYLLEILPAVVIDAVGWLFRREPRMIEKQKKLLKLRSVQEYFTLHQFTFLDYNVAGLRKTMSLEDRSIFDFNMNNIDWDSFIETYVIGLRKYLLKEDPGDELQ